MYCKKTENCPTSGDTWGSEGFLKGRYTGKNIRLLYDTPLDTSKYQIPGLLLVVNFEKAFDSVAWSFIEKSLNVFHVI